LIESSVLSQSS